ncbi:hypothetical protein FB451DRAFT_1415002 [Mycena latifolia]|nr:hypothetical protein FB451DRAFT_1415002 [Mycena latifolia]
MVHTADSTSVPTPAATELEALVSLISRLAVASSEATVLAVEVQAKLPAVLALHTASTTTWVRAPAKTPAELERAFPEGSGEVWYVVIRGKEPGMYRTAAEATALTSGVPHQFHRKKTSRREALLFYRDNYLDAAKAASANANATAAAGSSAVAPPGSVGVQKWVEVPPGTGVA